jgi:hypothetical protein
MGEFEDGLEVRRRRGGSEGEARNFRFIGAARSRKRSFRDGHALISATIEAPLLGFCAIIRTEIAANLGNPGADNGAFLGRYFLSVPTLVPNSAHLLGGGSGIYGMPRDCGDVFRKVPEP